MGQTTKDIRQMNTWSDFQVMLEAHTARQQYIDPNKIIIIIIIIIIIVNNNKTTKGWEKI